MILIPRARRSQAILAVVLVSLAANFLYFLYHGTPFSYYELLEKSVPTPSTFDSDSFKRKIQTSYAKYFQFLSTLPKEIPSIEFQQGRQTCIECPATSDDLRQHIKEDQRPQLDQMQQVHEKVWQFIRSADAPSQRQFGSVYNNGQGIVFIGGGKYSMMALLGIRSLRYHGSVLPVEVVIPSIAENDPHLCGELLPSLNATCVVLEEVLGGLLSEFRIESYQLKPLAMMASSFEEILFLDSDNIPVVNPDAWFRSEPYLTRGLILWPDFWSRGTSPWFYEIAQFDIDPYTQVRKDCWLLAHPAAGLTEEQSKAMTYHDLKGTLPNPTTESGSILLHKPSHRATLLLSLFYNTFGPQVFYELISQGQWGQGDKETYALAASKANEPWWQVKSKIRRIGIDVVKQGMQDDGRIFADWFEVTTGLRIKTTAMAQSDPVEDYLEYQRVLLLSMDNAGTFDAQFNDRKSKVALIHANHPKLDPVQLHKKFEGVLTNGTHYRIFADLNTQLSAEESDYDFELVQFQNMWTFTGCSNSTVVPSPRLKYLEELTTTDEICEYLASHLEYLKRPPI